MVRAHSWDELTVADICAAANVGRSTFYAHFTSKEDLVAAGFDRLREGLIRRQASARESPLFFVRGLFAHAAENREIFRAVVGHRSGEVIEKSLRTMVRALVRDDIERSIPRGPARDLAVHFLAGGVVETLLWWLRSEPAVPLDELTTRLEESADAVYRASSRPF